MATFDSIIRGGRVVDGPGAPRSTPMSGSSTAASPPSATFPGDGRQLIDARGKIVAPGHVSYHAPYDVQLFSDPYCSSAGENGTTTILDANCGLASRRSAAAT